MKPAAFEYSRPADLDEACTMLAGLDDARVIAGGQTLVPLMAMRLARPRHLIDIARLPELAFVRHEGDAIVIGATTRHCVLERDALVAAHLPLVAAAIPFIGHAPIRARGTIGGSLANADPAAELALVAVTLGASVRWRDGAGAAEVPVTDFLLGPMTTMLPAAALLTAVRFPVWPQAHVGVGFHEVNARRSDFAFASATAQIAVDDQARCCRVAVGIGAAAAVPLRLARVEAALTGTRAQAELVGAELAAALAEVELLSDLHASAAYRRRAATVLAGRAIADAYRLAVSRSTHAR